MGNSGSAVNSENEEEDTPKETIEDIEKDFGDIAVLDLTVLFDPKQLRLVADKIKEDTTVSPLQQHHTPLIRWLEERRSRGAETVTLMQFIDSFSNKGVSKEIATEIFQQFDTEGDGVVDLDYLHEMLDLSSRSIAGFSGVRSDLQAVNSILQGCFLAPGFIDAFTNSKTIQINHGRRLFKFLSRNRALSSSIPVPALKGFITATGMRLKVLNAHLNALKEKADSKKQEPPLQADEILKPINRCFTSAEVSSNRNEASKLIDNDNGTYWQSDGPARSHWVKLTIPPNVVIKQLSMYVVSSDQSYMPHHVVVHGGRDESNLRELNDVRIPNHITGDFTLLENLKIPYQVIQIFIKRCHSDGCDTRIRQIKAIGYRVVKSKGVSMMDATAMWYLSVLASTAQASLPVAPHLRGSIIQHTKVSLSHMNPLSLSTSSSEKPGFLSRNVMEQMENFLYSIICTDDGPVGEELIVLLEFAFSRGSLGSILEVLKLLLERIKNSYPAVSLLRSLSETEDKAIRKHGQKLPVVVLACDGGVKDSTTSPSNVLSDNWKTDAYFTETGKTKCNMAFVLKTGNLLMVTRVYMKLSKAPNAPRGGMIFVFDSDNIKDESGETLFQPLQEYDEWSEEDYRKMKEKGKNGYGAYDPVAYFTVDKDWMEVDVIADRLITGSCVVVKFFGPKSDSPKIGIVGINIFGYEQNEEIVQQQKNLDIYNQALSHDENEEMDGTIVLMRCLKFLQTMSKDAVNVKSQNVKDSIHEKDATIDIYDVSMKQIWNVYNLIRESDLKEDEVSIASEMVLNLFHIALPYLKPSAQRIRESRKLVSKGKKVNANKFEQEVAKFSSEVFQLLCDIVDGKPTSSGVHKIAKSIILDGAEVFFPDAEARRAHLLSLVSKVMEDEKAVSLAYTFESLCRFFSNKDASGLLGLPEYLPLESFKPTSVVHVMKTLVSVAFRECLSGPKEDGGDVPSKIVLLLCAMQKSLLAWCHIHCCNESARPIAVQILLEYVEMVCERCIEALKTIETAEKKIKAVDNLEYSFVSIAMRQLILFLNLFSNIEVNSIRLLRHMQPLAVILSKISKLLPELFTSGNGLESHQKQEDTVLREWELESEHEYGNNLHLNRVFNCPGCTSFKVEFAPQCQTERKYDYLEFTDSSGRKRRFDQSVGTEKWPLVVIFDAGQRLNFLFHTDGSNTAWGYRFKVSAIGSADVAVTWICDLQLVLARCFGSFCSSALDTKKAVGAKESNKEENEEERALLHSELWGSLFRGGYMVGKLERSLSGFHRTNPSDSMVNTFLGEIASTGDPTDKSEKSKAFLTRCKELYTGQKIGGGELMENAVNAVFSALIWHTQELREIAASFAGDNPPKDIPNSMIHAYKAAEGIRRTLLEHRQKILIQLDTPNIENTKENMDPDTPVVSCREKALFLLKFAGLSKFVSRKQSTHGIERRLSILNKAPKTIQRQESHEYKKASSYFEEANEKYPSFQLILDFVTNISLSHVKIHDLLQLRCKYAKTIAKVYTFAADYVDEMTELDQPKVPALLFLQSMLVAQDCFPQHYGDFLNGCGLETENLVRNAFYNFIRKLAEVIGSIMHLDKVGTSSPIFKCSQAYLLHFLDIEWKSYDYNFITELDLPYLLINSMKGAIVPSKEAEEENELKMYERHQRYFKEAKEKGINEWCNDNRQQAPVERQRDINLFIARYSTDLDVVITCDGCEEKIKGSRYRCLNCVDMDLCSMCYRKGTKPNDHTDQHEVIDLRFTCDNCKAFIVETRIHCNECNDFDLCFGCYKHGRYPERHNSSHSVSKSHLIPGGLLQTKVAREKFLQSYIHHHSWLQFSAIALSLSENLQSKKGVETQYSKHAIQLLLQCLYKLVDSLLTPNEPRSNLTKTEDTFSRISKVTFDDVEQIVEVVNPNHPEELIQHKAESVLDTLNAEDPSQLQGTFSHPLSEPTISRRIENISPEVTNDEYFSMSSDRAHVSDTILGMPALEESDSEGEEEFNRRSDLNNIGIDEVDESELNKTGSNLAEVKYSQTNVKVLEVVTNIETVSDTAIMPDENRDESIVDYSNTNVTTDDVDGTESELDSKTEKQESAQANSHSESAKTKSDSESTTTKSDPGLETVKSDVEISLTKSDSEPTKFETENKDSESDRDIKEDTVINLDVITDKDYKKYFSPEKKNTEENDDDILFDQEANSKAYMQEKLIGLIGAVIPTEKNGQAFIHSALFHDFVAKKLLPALFTIVKDKTSHEKLRLVTLGVLAKTFHCFGPEVADVGTTFSIKLEKETHEIECQQQQDTIQPTKKDEAQTVMENISNVEESAETKRHPGEITVEYLFNLGANCFQDSDLETASGVDTVLKSLWSNSKWSEPLTLQANETLHELSTNSVNPSLLCLFSLMFLAGFPDIFHQGSIAHVKEGGDEIKTVVVLEYCPTYSVSAINFKNRKKISVKEHAMEAVRFWNEYLDKARLPLLLDIMQKMFLANKGQATSVERMWVLGLICKALLNILKTGIDKDNMLKIVNSGAVSYIINVACQGTGFSNQWLLCDLEVLSWRLYKAGKTPQPSTTATEAVTSTDKDSSTPQTKQTDCTSDNDKTKSSLPVGIDVGSADAVTVNEIAVAATRETRSPLDGLDNETRLCMETIHDALNCPYPILRAIYEHFGRDRDKLLEEVQRSFDGTTGCSIRPSDEIRELAKSWEKRELEGGEENFLSTVDSSTDVGILKFQPQKVEFKDLRAKPEGGENPNKLISSLTEAEIKETMLQQRRSKSAELLLKELQTKTRENTREFSKKLNHAVAVGYARHLAGWLFASWPSSEGIVSETLDNISPHSIVGLLDLIQSVESKEHFQKVVHNFIRCCTKQLVQPLALSAVQCMGDARLASETRESEHKYKNNSKVEDKVHIPGATSLFIKFDDRCSTEHNCDELLISSSSNFLQNRRLFSGSNGWHDFEMPGDTVYYRFTSDSSNTEWGWKFTVTGGQLGRFETGCSILSALLAQDLQFARRLPLKQLWSWLIAVACDQVGQQRLMATGLLLRILQIAAGDPSLFGEDKETTFEKHRLNLSLLRPLWSLYTSSIESDTGTSLALISPVIRGLSELFLVVENVAQDWGIADDLVAGLATDQKLKNCFTKVVSNIAAIGLAIGIPNKALDMIQQAKQNPPSPTLISDSKDLNASIKKRPARIGVCITGDSDENDDNDDDDDRDDPWVQNTPVQHWTDSDDTGDTDNDDSEDDDDDDDSDDSDFTFPSGLPP